MLRPGIPVGELLDPTNGPAWKTLSTEVMPGMAPGDCDERVIGVEPRRHRVHTRALPVDGRLVLGLAPAARRAPVVSDPA